MANSKTKKNYIYNLIYQIFSLITPLITTPYISRVLGSAGIGQYSFTVSIVTYFSLLATLGFSTYAQREIARHQEDRKKQSIIFWEVIIARLISVSISISVYLVVLFCGIHDQKYITLMCILVINIIAVAFDVSFFFQGNESFLIIVICNLIIKLLGIVCILLFVKNETHVWLYALFQSMILILSNLSLWSFLPRFLSKVNISELNPKRHILPTLRLFIPTVAASVYTMLDKTLIGVMIPGVDEFGNKIADVENGYYEQSEKLIKMALTIITSLGTVMIPRNSKLIADGDFNKFKNNIKGALIFVFFLGSPIMFGLASVAFNMSPWFFGEGYEKVPYLMAMFSPLILIIGLSSVLGIHYLLPKQKDKKYTIAITSGALLNVCLNFVLIPHFWSFGACVATIASELVITFMMFVFARKDVNIFLVLLSSWKYLVSGALMFCLVFFTQLFMAPTLINTALLVCEGAAVYFSLLLLFRDKIVLNFTRKIINCLINRRKNSFEI